LGLKLGRYGSFIGCSNYPTCQYTRRLAIETGEEQGETLKEGMRELGQHPETGEEITVRRGPYGLYVQQGENGESKVNGKDDKGKGKEKKVKPKRTSLPRGMDGDQITLEQAIGLLSLPRVIGTHPETNENIEAGIGRFGPYVRMGAIYGSLDRDDDVLNIGINRGVDLIARKMASVRTVGAHPGDKEFISVRKGRFGPYLQHGKMVANLPRGVMMEEITLEQAVALLVEKGKPLRPRGAAGRRGRATAAAKPQAESAASASTAVKAPVKAPVKAKATAKPAKRRAAKPKRAAPKPSAKRAVAAKAPAKKKAARRSTKSAARRRPAS
jgi:DNA topoisomerase I